MFFVGDFCDVGITRSPPCVLYFTEIKMENTNCQNGQKFAIGESEYTHVYEGKYSSG